MEALEVATSSARRRCSLGSLSWGSWTRRSRSPSGWGSGGPAKTDRRHFGAVRLAGGARLELLP